MDIPPQSGVIQCALRQQENPMVKHIQNAPVSFVNIITDFRIGYKVAVFFSSLAYHRRNPDTLEQRLKNSQDHTRAIRCRVLLIHVNVDDPDDDIETVTRIGYLYGYVVMLGWSFDECARILELYCLQENKSAEAIQGNLSSTHAGRLVEALARLPGINRSDAQTLLLEMDSLANIANASKDDLEKVSGIGKTKVELLYDVMQADFNT